MSFRNIENALLDFLRFRTFTTCVLAAVSDSAVSPAKNELVVSRSNLLFSIFQSKELAENFLEMRKSAGSAAPLINGAAEDLI